MIAWRGEKSEQPNGLADESVTVPVFARLAHEHDQAAELFHTPGADAVAYVTMNVDAHRETWPLHSRVVRHYIERRIFIATGTLPRPRSVDAMLRLLTAEALFHGSERAVWTRLATMGTGSTSILAILLGGRSRSCRLVGVSWPNRR